MKEEMTSLDLHFILKEIKGLIGGKFGKIYQKGKNFRIEIYVPGKASEEIPSKSKGKSYELILAPGRLYLTQYRRQAPIQPPNFCMFLRKHLNRKTIREIKQYKFDRVLQIHTDENILIAELFSKGNVILCDSSYNIIMPLEVQKWSEREISPDRKYKYPPTGKNPKTMELEDLRSVLREKEVVKFLASDLGFGGTYAEEICLRSSLDKNKPGSKLDPKETINLHKAIKSMFEDKSPGIIYEDEKTVDVVPIQMKLYQDKEREEFDSFSEALDNYFSEKEKQEFEEKKEKKYEEEVEKLERRKDEQEEAKEKWEEIEEESKTQADLLYENYQLVEGILNGINKARNSGLSWNEVKRRVKNEDTPEAEAIKEIKENNGKVLTQLEGEEIELDFRESVEENAERLYEDSKWAREKSESAGEAIKETKKEKEGIEEEGKESIEIEKEKPVKRKEREKKWYEKFRWSKTSEGFLVIGGKDATQNEIIIKKHTRPEDVVLHAEIKGAPFVVVKAESKEEEITPLAIREAAEISAAYSSAWKKGYGNVDVYWVKPEQVSKEAPAGEHLEKGSFMIKGKKNYLRKRELKISIGVKVDRKERSFEVMSGSVQSMRSNMDYFVTVKPGDKKSLKLAEEIKRKIMEKSIPEDKKIVDKIPREEFQKFIPPGKGMLIE